MILNKEEIYQIEVIDLDFEGQGVGKIDSFPIFIEQAIPGDLLNIKLTKIEKSFAYGRILSIKKPSSKRNKPLCKHFFECGGCNIMHLNEAFHKEYKTHLLKDALYRVGKVDIAVEDLLSSSNLEYRNKVEIPVREKNNTIVCGFYNNKSHDIFNLCECSTMKKSDFELLSGVKKILTDLGIKAFNEERRTGSIRHIIIRSNYLDEKMIILVTKDQVLTNKDKLISNIINQFTNVKSIVQNINDKNNSVVMGYKSKVIYGSSFIVDRIGDLFFEISAESFFQVNRYSTELLYEKALEYAELSSNDIVIDAYSGIGTISLFIARKAKYVYGIEIVEQAHRNAISNMKRNKISNVTFINGSCEDKIKELVNKEKIDCIFFDPPRKGCEESFLNTVIEMKIKKIVYVSCNIRTQARDISYLVKNGYQVIKAAPVDMFPWTSHVESVTLLCLKEPRNM